MSFILRIHSWDWKMRKTAEEEVSLVLGLCDFWLCHPQAQGSLKEIADRSNWEVDWGLTGWYKEYPGHGTFRQQMGGKVALMKCVPLSWTSPGRIPWTTGHYFQVTIYRSLSDITKVHKLHISYIWCHVYNHRGHLSSWRTQKKKVFTLVRWNLFLRPERFHKTSGWTTSFSLL